MSEHQASTKPLACAYAMALLDLDGVVYVGKQAVGYASESIQRAQSLGMLVMYTTNNSSRFPSVVANQLAGFGLSVDDDEVITSSIVASRLIAHHVPQGAKVLVVGADHLRDAVRSQGFTVVSHVSDEPQAVVQGWYPELSWNELAQAAYGVELGVPYIVTNRDVTIPREFGIAPGCGSMIQAVINATGVEPIASAGKPQREMYDEARGIAQAKMNCIYAIEDCLAIGDRLDTDIEAANRGGYHSLAVLTGVTNPRELMQAAPIYRPTYIAQDLRDLAEPYPQVNNNGDTEFQCEQDWARVQDSSISVSDSHSINALRAACALAWHYADEHGTMPDVPNIEIA